MAIATARVGVALDRCASRYRHRPGVAFVSVSGKRDADGRLGSAHHRVRNSNIRTLVFSRAKIGMHAYGWSDEVDDRAGIRIHRRPGNILVPEIVAAEGSKSIEAGALPGAHRAAGALGRAGAGSTRTGATRTTASGAASRATRTAAGATSSSVQSRARCASATIRAGKCQCQRGRAGQQPHRGKMHAAIVTGNAGQAM
jgi:hypothetical protein